ncbi:unnamed protein product [Amoebophrya sp. A25]|nr:unnamed protein product [Amoebophrya sp. A25]|eukprot:GSA25T00027219001.1
MSHLLDPYKYSFPAAIPGGGGSLPPATATMMWANGVKGHYEAAQAAHNKLVSNGNRVETVIARMSAAMAQSEQAKLAAESSAAAAFARDNGFAVAAATADVGPLGCALSLVGSLMLKPVEVDVSEEEVVAEKQRSENMTGEDDDDDDDDDEKHNKEGQQEAAVGLIGKESPTLEGINTEERRNDGEADSASPKRKERLQKVGRKGSVFRRKPPDTSKEFL